MPAETPTNVLSLSEYRTKKVLREANDWTCQSIEIDTITYTLTIDDEEVTITPDE